MKVTEVNLKLTTLLDLLNEGHTWFKSEDVGYGSIQEKYNATELQINKIKSHPKLKNVEPNIVVFNIEDDTAEESLIIKDEPAMIEESSTTESELFLNI